MLQCVVAKTAVERGSGIGLSVEPTMAVGCLSKARFARQIGGVQDMSSFARVEFIHLSAASASLRVAEKRPAVTASSRPMANPHTLRSEAKDNFRESFLPPVVRPPRVQVA